MGKIRLHCKESIADVSAFGGMTVASFCLNGKMVSPFYHNPWKDSASDPFLAHLKGDFFCLPFGIAPGREIPGWGGGQSFPQKEYSHGYSANGCYEVTERRDNTVTLRLYYDTNDVEYVERGVTLFETHIEFADTVMPKRDFCAPVGYHPIFKIPQEAGGCRLLAPACGKFMSYPAAVDESSIFAPGAAFDRLSGVPLADGITVDASLLPLLQDTEELVCALQVKEGAFKLQYPEEGYEAKLNWDASVLPHCLIWISNRGRKNRPWSGRNLCVGIEPVASAFDMGQHISAGENPLSKEEYRTCISFRANEAMRLVHSISVKEL